MKNNAKEIKTIRLPLPFRLGVVNCYLIITDSGYILIDTGCTNKRTILEKELVSAGCTSYNFRLIILTHGDFDHTSNAAYLHNKFGALTAIHPDDAAAVQHGDMFRNREKHYGPFKLIVPIVFRFGKSERFVPDLLVTDNYDFSPYGFDAKVVHLPGHSKGSIGILTADGDLFCGDLLSNSGTPALTSIIDNAAEANNSVAKLKELPVKTVYPGHGKPFSMDMLRQNT